MKTTDRAAILCDISASDLNGYYGDFTTIAGDLGWDCVDWPYSPTLQLAFNAADAAAKTPEGRRYIEQGDHHLVDALAAQMIREGWMP